MNLFQGKHEEKEVDNDIKSSPENTNDNKQLLDQYLARVTYKLEMDQIKTHVQVKARWFLQLGAICKLIRLSTLVLVNSQVY